MVKPALTLPQTRECDWEGWHRLIPSRYSEEEDPLSALAGDSKELNSLNWLQSATSKRAQGERQGVVGISVFELVYAIPNGHIVNAAFTHAAESGSRFNDHTRGAWYAADCQPASVAEVVYHKARRLGEIMVPDAPNQRPERDVSTYDDWLADFHADFHILHPPADFADVLQPEAVPQCYAVSQSLARQLLGQGSNGLVYPSVRYPEAQCIACFRPALVYRPRRAECLEITLTANDTGYDHSVHKVKGKPRLAGASGLSQ